MTQSNSVLMRDRGHLISWAIVAATLIVSSISLSVAPAQVPIHWDIHGKVDQMGSPFVGLLIIPGICLGMQLLAIFLPRIDPGKQNFISFHKTYWTVFLTIQGYLFAFNVLLCLASLGWGINMSVAVPLMVGLLLIILGNYMGKLRPNWMMGIRTPWTLSSKRSWDKTHRLGGWLMMLMGMASACTALVPNPITLIALGAFMVICLMITVIYSWYVWNNDPDRISASGVSPADPDQDISNISGQGTLTLALAVASALSSLVGTSTAFGEETDSTSTSIEMLTTTGKLYATLDLPTSSGPKPVVLILAGSGPTDADGNSAGTKNDSLKLLGQALAANGIAACRIDKRGVGRSAAAFVKEGDLRFETYVSDANDWIKLLKADKRFSAVHVLGHSEGALTATVAAKDANVASAITVAGTGRRASDLMRTQLVSKVPPAGMQQIETILQKLEAGEQVADVGLGLQVLFRPSVQPYLISWFKYDPAKEIATLSKTPVMIVQGSTDIQCSNEDADLLATALPTAKKAILQGMNHVLKKSEGSTVQDQLITYTDPSLPLHEELVPTIVKFIRSQDAKENSRP